MPSTEELFNSDLKDLHLIYDYDVVEDGKPAKWRYEMWFFSFKRIVYAIHGGPMAGRNNYQTAEYQCMFEFVRSGARAFTNCIVRHTSWRIMAMQRECLLFYLEYVTNHKQWLEETGTICSLVYDIKEKKISTLLGFSKGAQSIKNREMSC